MNEILQKFQTVVNMKNFWRRRNKGIKVILLSTKIDSAGKKTYYAVFSAENFDFQFVAL